MEIQFKFIHFGTINLEKKNNKKNLDTYLIKNILLQTLVPR